MLRSERMKLVTVFAERGVLPALVHTLHAIGRVQLVPSTEIKDAFINGTASYRFYPAEGYLVELRGIKEHLALRPPAAPRVVSDAEMLPYLPEQLLDLFAAVRTSRERIDKLVAEQQTIASELAELEPFLPLEMPLNILDGCESVRVYAIGATTAMAECPVSFAKLASYKVGTHPSVNVHVIAVESPQAEEFRHCAEEHGAWLIDLPSHRTNITPAEQAAQLRARAAHVAADLDRERRDLAALGEKNREFIFAAEEVLAVLARKNTGSSHFATSEYALAVRFWVPESDLLGVYARIHERFPTGVEIVTEKESVEAEHAEAEHAAAEPTRLNNPGWCKPFETVTELFDVPSSREIDPTAMLAIFFPLFFGFMVGDVGYGGLIALLGYVLWRTLGRRSEQVGHMAYVLILGGLSGLFFGYVIFGDMFGIPFHNEGESIFYWSRVFPAALLPHPILIKTETGSVSEMLFLSVLVGWLHMSLGCIFGILNEWKHSLRHAGGRLGQFLLVSGFTLLIVSLDGLRDTHVGHALWVGPLLPITWIGTSHCILAMLGVGLVLSVIGEGFGAVIEFFGLFGNVISFTRLALVGVSKAAAAVAVNTVLLPGLLEGRSALLTILLIVALFAGHTVLLLMAALSASIQSVRLHFCETFMKFFKGNGHKFVPFGLSRTYTRSL